MAVMTPYVRCLEIMDDTFDLQKGNRGQLRQAMIAREEYT